MTRTFQSRKRVPSYLTRDFDVVQPPSSEQYFFQVKTTNHDGSFAEFVVKWLIIPVAIITIWPIIYSF